MIGSANDILTATKDTRSGRFDQQQFADIHCHCLPAVDDGPATEAEALALCRELVYDGVTNVRATPHQLGAFNDSSESAQVRENVLALNKELESNGTPLAVVPGGDVRVDERICQLLEADKILTLADGGKYILLELPQEVFIDIEPLLAELASLGIQAIISHPERHPALAKQPRALLRWLEQQAHLQVTSASLLGDFGPLSEQAAWRFLRSGWASLVATDSHDSGGNSACFIARLVCEDHLTKYSYSKNGTIR